MLKSFSRLVLGLVLLGIAGCGAEPSSPEKLVRDAEDAERPQAEHRELAELQKNLDAVSRLAPEDQQLAKLQGFCAVFTTSPLGSMGTPVKLELNGETVFLCCAGCKGKALRNPELALANVAKLKSASDAAR
jgi:hypothetical protein